MSFTQPRVIRQWKHLKLVQNLLRLSDILIVIIELHDVATVLKLQFALQRFAI